VLARPANSHSSREPFRTLCPIGFLSLFTQKGAQGRRLALLALILALQAAHDGEGDAAALCAGTLPATSRLRVLC